MTLDRAAIEAHKEWIGYVQPQGLVVAPAVLVEHQVILDRNLGDLQDRLLALVDDPDEPQRVTEPTALFTQLLGWRESDLVPAPAELDRHLEGLGVYLRAAWAVPHGRGVPPEAGPWQMLVHLAPAGADPDHPLPEAPDGWHASPHDRLERHLRETGIATGLLVTPERVRLVHAPRGETAGWADFRIHTMALPAGKPVLAAFACLLGARRLFQGPLSQRLALLLEASRKAQTTVSTALAGQVQEALYCLLDGFVEAGRVAGGEGLAALARTRPDHLYGGLVTTLMRLVFILYAEDRDLMPGGEDYHKGYGLGSLYARLREEADRFPDTMDQRYGAWGQLLALFRLVHKGGGHGAFRFTARKGHLFDPEAYPFLEGRDPALGGRVPAVPDGTVLQVLERLLILDGERVMYRTLDVEQIGSVYETIMGFEVRLTSGPSLAIRGKKAGRPPVIVDLAELLALKPADRAKRFREATDRDLPAAGKEAKSVDALAAALDRLVAGTVTPQVLPAGVPVLQPTDERRRSGSHYTPRSLTAPIVAETLRPILSRLGPQATPEQILELKVLDPAMGSGAFLVEACRQLAEALVKAWEVHGRRLDLPADEDLLTHAKRLVAQRCLYGLDKNPLAAELGKLSLWLATLARDHEFTFLDHAIRHGNFLVGLDRRQIETLSWEPSGSGQHSFFAAKVQASIEKVEKERERIRSAVDGASEEDLRSLLDRAQAHLADVRLVADAVVAAFFAGAKPKEREKERERVKAVIGVGGSGWQEKLGPAVAALRRAGIVPFHFAIELPEVFDRENPGFDAIVGNPPFAGKNNVAASYPEAFLDWLKTLHEGAHGNADLAAHFFRRSFVLLRQEGAFGLIATNTIRQGDTRGTGLRAIRKAGGVIYTARRRIKWPGEAAVVVCVVHVHKGYLPPPYRIDGRQVPQITAFLFHAGGDDDPLPLAANENKSFQGSIVLGMGFTFDDTDTKGVANPTSLMRDLIAKDPHNAERIFPYIGGEELNDSPTHAHHRWVINFEDMSEVEARKWPDLMAIVVEKVKSQRISLPPKNDWNRNVAEKWWLFGANRRELEDKIRDQKRVLAIARVGQHAAFSFLPSGMVYSEQLVVFALKTNSTFCALQSRPHEIWARFFASSLEDRLRYTPSDCFETFPLPPGFDTNPALEAAGKAYYERRAAIMVARNEGLTKTYNRFHDPACDDPDIVELRALHDAMDRAVLAAYGWSDLAPVPVFELEWEDEEEGEGSRRRKKPWRYRWPEDARDEVLARLLALNAERAAAERRPGRAA